MKKILFLIISSFFLTACGNDTFDKAMEQGKVALAKGEFDKALGLFELALEEKPKDQEALQNYENLTLLGDIEDSIEQANWEDALTKANILLEEEDLPSNLKQEVERLAQQAETEKGKKQAVTEKIEEIKVLVSGKKYGEAKKLIDELKQDESVLKSYSEEINNLEATVNEEIEKQKEAEAKAKAQAEEKKKNEVRWDTYTNGRFGFTVKYPQGWVLGPEPTNGDGRSLYNENDAEILAYAYHYMEETKPDLSGYEKLKTNEGVDAFLLVNQESALIEFDGVIINGEIVFHLNGQMSREFYEKNSKVLREMLVDVRLN